MLSHYTDYVWLLAFNWRPQSLEETEMCYKLVFQYTSSDYKLVFQYTSSDYETCQYLLTKSNVVHHYLAARLFNVSSIRRTHPFVVLVRSEDPLWCIWSCQVPPASFWDSPLPDYRVSRLYNSVGCDQIMRVGFTLLDLFPDITDRISSIWVGQWLLIIANMCL